MKARFTFVHVWARIQPVETCLGLGVKRGQVIVTTCRGRSITRAQLVENGALVVGGNSIRQRRLGAIKDHQIGTLVIRVTNSRNRALD